MADWPTVEKIQYAIAFISTLKIAPNESWQFLHFLSENTMMLIIIFLLLIYHSYINSYMIQYFL